MIVCQLILPSSLVPHSLALVVDCDLHSFFSCALPEKLSVDIHLWPCLSHHESFLFAVGHYHEFHSFSPETSFLAVIGNYWSNCWCWTFASQDLFGFFKVIKVGQVDSHHILPSLSIFIGLFCLFIGSLAFLCFSVFDQNSLGLNFLHNRSSLLEHFEVQVKSSCLLEILCLFVDLSCLQILLHILTDNRNISQKRFVLDLSGNVESSLDISQFYQSSGHPCEAFNIVPFNNSLADSLKLIIHHWFLKLFQSFSVVAKRLSLSR